MKRPEGPREQVEELRQQLQRSQLYLAMTLVAIGLGAVVSAAVVGFFSFRLADQVETMRVELEAARDEASVERRAIVHDLAQQQREIAAIRRAAADDLAAIQEAHRRVSKIRDPRGELAELRDANQALWSELADQRSELLDALDQLETQPGEPALPTASGERFHLGRTLHEPASPPGGLRGFLADGKEVHSATSAPSNPAQLVIRLTPDDVALGETFSIEIQLVNFGNHAVAMRELRLDWTLSGQRTGGAVPILADAAKPRATTAIYEVAGTWTPAHDTGSGRLSASLTLESGDRVSNELWW